jgi:hypothetical protein
MSSKQANAQSGSQSGPKAAPAAERRRDSNLVPMLVVLFSVLSGIVLFAWGPDNTPTAPQPNYRADAPAPPK